MKFEIKQSIKGSGYPTDSFNLHFNDEMIVEQKSKEKILKIVNDVLVALI